MIHILLEAWPAAACTLTPRGSLPLHLATSYAGDCPETIELVLNSCPRSAFLRGAANSVMNAFTDTEVRFHACQESQCLNCASKSVIMSHTDCKICQKHESMHEQRVHAENPESVHGLHIIRVEDNHSEVAWLPLHYAVCLFGECTASIELLIRANPMGLLMSCAGWLPLHLAVRHHPNCQELLQLLTLAFPGVFLILIPFCLLMHLFPHLINLRTCNGVC